jgi:hypothetical protein
MASCEQALATLPRLRHVRRAPPPDHLAELRWALLVEAALRTGDGRTADIVRRARAPAAGGLIDAGTGMLSFGPAAELLARLAAVRRPPAGPAAGDPGDQTPEVRTMRSEPGDQRAQAVALSRCGSFHPGRTKWQVYPSG